MQTLLRRLVLISVIAICMCAMSYTLARSRVEKLNIYLGWTSLARASARGEGLKDNGTIVPHVEAQIEVEPSGRRDSLVGQLSAGGSDERSSPVLQSSPSKHKKYSKPHCSSSYAAETTREWHRPIYRKFPRGRKNYKELMKLNGTVFAGGFLNVLLVITRAHAHVLTYLHAAYKPYFWDILFLQPRKFGDEDQAKFAKGGIVVEMCHDMPHLERCPGKGSKPAWCQPDCPLDGNGQCMDAMYNCLSRILPLMLETTVIDVPNASVEAKLRRSDRDALIGTLVIHADAWVAPWFGKGLNLNNLIHVTSDTAMCYSTQFAQMAEATERVAVEFEASGQLPIAAFCSCRAWFDLYYLPRGAWLAWSRAAKAIGQRTALPLIKAWGPLVLWNEDALPLSFHVAAKFGSCQSEGGCKLQKMDCWGGAGPETPQTMVTVMYQACGHKINFGLNWHETKFLELWKNLHKEKVREEGSVSS